MCNHTPWTKLQRGKPISCGDDSPHGCVSWKPTIWQVSDTFSQSMQRRLPCYSHHSILCRYNSMTVGHWVRLVGSQAMCGAEGGMVSCESYLREKCDGRSRSQSKSGQTILEIKPKFRCLQNPNSWLLTPSYHYSIETWNWTEIKPGSKKISRQTKQVCSRYPCSLQAFGHQFVVSPLYFHHPHHTLQVRFWPSQTHCWGQEKLIGTIGQTNPYANVLCKLCEPWSTEWRVAPARRCARKLFWSGLSGVVKKIRPSNFKQTDWDSDWFLFNICTVSGTDPEPSTFDIIYNKNQWQYTRLRLIQGQQPSHGLDPGNEYP